MLRILVCLSLAATLLNACTIQKRTFRKGWHIEWKQHHDPVAAAPEKQDRETLAPAIRAAIVPVASEDLPAEQSGLVAETSIPEKSTLYSGEEAVDEVVHTDVIVQTDPVQYVADPVLSTEKTPAPDAPDDAPTPNGLWWIVALLVGIALAATIWLSVGTGGSGALLVALFVALVGSVIGAVVLSMRIKRMTPKEEEVDIEFDELTENEIKRKKKLKGLIAALVLVVVGVTIILVGSK